MKNKIKIILPSIGTRSLLFGVHCWFIHPLFVFVAWWQLYGFPWDIRLWIAFFVHDLGYLGKPNMDGPEGERHVVFAAEWMGSRFGAEWGDFCRLHSRFWAKKAGRQFSRLCVADKQAIVLTPVWLYLLLGNLSGEIHEYMDGKGARTPAQGRSQVAWFLAVRRYVEEWVKTHKDGAEDSWTGTKRDLCLDG